MPPNNDDTDFYSIGLYNNVGKIGYCGGFVPVADGITGIDYFLSFYVFELSEKSVELCDFYAGFCYAGVGGLLPVNKLPLPWNNPPWGDGTFGVISSFFCPNNDPDNGVGVKTGGVSFFY